MERQEYQELCRTLDYHMDRYYNQDEPEISDYEYDCLMHRLKQAEREHPDWVTPESPSQKIGGSAACETGAQVEHRVPMLSIEDVFEKKELADWADKVQEVHPDATFSVEVKVDGVSLSLRYERQGEALALTLAETRGNGRVGGDVTANALAMADVPAKLPLSCSYLELRGEVYVTREAYRRYLAEPGNAGEAVAETPRNLAAATLRQQDPAAVRARELRMLVFNVQDGPAELMDRHTAGMQKLESAGIAVVPHWHCANAAEILQVLREIERLRPTLPYETDGVAVKLDQIAYREDFPVGPKYAAGHIAYKFPPDGVQPE